MLGAWDWLAAQGVPKDRIGILGMSFGAATTVIAGGEEPGVRAVWEDSSFADDGRGDPRLPRPRGLSDDPGARRRARGEDRGGRRPDLEEPAARDPALRRAVRWRSSTATADTLLSPHYAEELRDAARRLRRRPARVLARPRHGAHAGGDRGARRLRAAPRRLLHRRAGHAVAAGAAEAPVSWRRDTARRARPGRPARVRARGPLGRPDPRPRRAGAVGQPVAAARRRPDRPDERFPVILEMIPYGKDSWRRTGTRRSASGWRPAGSRCAGSTSAARAARPASRSTSTPRPRPSTGTTPSSGWRPSRGATATSACGASATAGSPRSRSPSSGRRTSARSCRCTRPTTAIATTSTSAAAASPRARRASTRSASWA